jgi:hypothetical protein
MSKKLKLLLVVGLSVLSGCRANTKETLFEKESDTLSKSYCAACHDKPFYVNGRWM